MCVCVTNCIYVLVKILLLVELQVCGTGDRSALHSLPGKRER